MFLVAQTIYTPVILGGEYDADVVLMIWKKIWGQKLKKSWFFQKNPKTEILRKIDFF